MTTKYPSYEHDLGNGLLLEAYSLNPKINKLDLEGMILSKDGKSEPVDLCDIAKDILVVAELNSLKGLEINVSDEVYSVPKQLQSYRSLLGDENERRRRIEAYRCKAGNVDALQDLYAIFNGSVLVIKGDVKLPLGICRGGFFDFKATELIAIPSLLLPEVYPTGETISKLLPKYGLDINQLARYLAFAFIVLLSNGEEVSFVHRAKGLGIAPDCMAISGATPYFHEDFFKKGFNFQQYFESEVKREIREEYKLLPHEFTIGKCYLTDDKKSIPCVAIEIITYLSTHEIAERCYGDIKVNREHTILYSVNRNAIPMLISRFPLDYYTAYVLDRVIKKEHR